MNIKCIVTDDEPMARKGLLSYIEKVDFLTLSGVCEDGMQLNSLLKRESVDLLFLDIEMPYLSGIELLAGLQNPPKVIITSAYEKYALKGYEFDVADYLLKPISFDRFLKSVNRVHEQLQREQPEDSDTFIFVKTDNKLIRKVFFDDILYIEALENYVSIQLADEKVITHITLKNILQSLPESFWQVHKSYIVNSTKVQLIEGNMLGIDKYRVPISRNLRDEVFNKMLHNRLA